MTSLKYLGGLLVFKTGQVEYPIHATYSNMLYLISQNLREEIHFCCPRHFLNELQLVPLKLRDKLYRKCPGNDPEAFFDETCVARKPVVERRMVKARALRKAQRWAEMENGYEINKLASKIERLWEFAGFTFALTMWNLFYLVRRSQLAY